MSEINREYIVRLLSDYSNNKRRIAQLAFELDNFKPVTPEEMMEAMAYAHPSGIGGHSGGTVSDATARIAMEYRERAAEANAQRRDDLACRLMTIMQEVERLEAYVRMLPELQATVLSLHYFEGLNWEEVGGKIDRTANPVRRLKDAAIGTLVEMYRFAED